MTAAAAGGDTALLPPPLLLSLGEVAGAPPEPVAYDVAAAIARGSVRYGPPEGLPPVRDAVAQNLGVETDEIVMTAGASGGLLAFLLMYSTPGGNILTPDPGYPGYAGLARRLGLQSRHYRLAPGLDAVDIDDVERGMDAGTAAVVVTSPGNPTGRSIDAANLLAVAAAAARRDVPLVVDQAYGDLAIEPAVHPRELWEVHPGAVVLRSYSKTFCLSGFRAGAVVTPSALAPQLASAHYGAVMTASTAGQWAVLSCLSHNAAPYLDAVRDRLRRRAEAARRALAWEAQKLDEAGPGSTTSVTADLGVFAWVRTSRPAARVAEELWQQDRIAVLPGAACGPSGSHHLRILADIDSEALARVADALRARR